MWSWTGRVPRESSAGARPPCAKQQREVGAIHDAAGIQIGGRGAGRAPERQHRSKIRAVDGAVLGCVSCARRFDAELKLVAVGFRGVEFHDPQRVRTRCERRSEKSTEPGAPAMSGNRSRPTSAEPKWVQPSRGLFTLVQSAGIEMMDPASMPTKENAPPTDAAESMIRSSRCCAGTAMVT